MDNISLMYANSKKRQLLTDHSKGVAIIAQYACQKIGVTHPEFLKQVKWAGLFHDLGKAVTYFQDYMEVKLDDINAEIDIENYDAHKDSALHHEISWAYLSQKFHKEDFKLMLNVVYWHHARPLGTLGDYHSNAKDILSIPHIKDSIGCLDSLFEYLCTEYGIEVPEVRPRDLTNHVPNLFLKDNDYGVMDEYAEYFNEEAIILRACLVAADRFVSSLENRYLKQIVGLDIHQPDFSKILKILGWFKPSSKISISTTCPEGYDSTRFNAQVGCVKSITNQTTLIKAPAGYGKSLMGILWSHGKSGQIFWVCPRNGVALGVYDNIVRELRALNSDMSVELYYSGDIQKQHNTNNPHSFSADIVVTNIDNILLPSIKNRASRNMYKVLSGNIVFDEFHEFVCDEPIFSLFITLMKTRHQLLTNVNTLLLSATPSLIHKLFETSDKRIGVLPSENNHYAAGHGKPYDVVFLEKEREPTVLLGNQVIMSNSVKQAQYFYKKLGATHLTHSKFIKSDRDKKLSEILNIFGKSNKAKDKQESVSCALDLQAAHDISFKSGYISSMSPETTLQELGRINRWGEYPEASVNITSAMSRSCSSAITNLYDTKLHKNWCDYCRQIGNSQVTLDEVYLLYNKFNSENSEDIVEYLQTKYKKACEHLEDFYATKRRYYEELEQTGVDNFVISKSLRNTSLGRYITIQYNGTEKWLDPENVINISSQEYNNYRDKNLQEMSNSPYQVVKGLVNQGYVEYGSILDRMKSYKKCLDFDKLSKRSGTPYPWFVLTYDEELGIIEKN